MSWSISFDFHPFPTSDHSLSISCSPGLNPWEYEALIALAGVVLWVTIYRCSLIVSRRTGVRTYLYV
eukprot:1583791-Ditylum_brightwellii.AAC.1